MNENVNSGAEQDSSDAGIARLVGDALKPLSLVRVNDDFDTAIRLLPRDLRLLDKLRRIEADSSRRHDKLRWPKAACLDLHRVNPHRVHQIGLHAFRPTLAEIEI